MRILILVALLSGLVLTGCGNRGGLERPAPLWGGERAEIPVEAEDAEDDLFADEDDNDGLPSIPGQDPFDDDDWDD